jgi:hypothetical protein
MAEYPIVAILWEDHLSISRATIPKDADKELIPTLSIGILYNETEKTVTLVSDIERYHDRDDTTFFIILKSTIVSMREYGKIKVKKLRT